MRPAQDFSPVRFIHVLECQPGEKMGAAQPTAHEASLLMGATMAVSMIGMFRAFSCVENLFHNLWLPPLRKPCARRGLMAHAMPRYYLSSNFPHFFPVIPHYRNRSAPAAGRSPWCVN